jgi:hypothetical protein
MENKVKYYTSKEICREYENLTYKEKNEILYEAIDIMNQYNGRTRFLCIAMAMGYRNDEGLDSYYYKT